MKTDDIDKLVKHKIIEDPFDYQGFDDEIVDKYKYFEQIFKALFTDKANQYKLRDCYFFIKSDVSCNAFARTKKGYNIISITNGYPIQMLKIFDEKYFLSLILIAIVNDKYISNAYVDLYNLENFKFHKFMLDCSCRFTFGHEFQHILQFNSSKISANYYRSENLNAFTFEMKRHAWEFDADRFASFEVLKYIFEIKREHQIKDDNVFKCMLYTGLSSIFITKVFFYLKFNSLSQTLNKIDFYTKKYSHPHPMVRLFNIIDYFYDNVTDTFPTLTVDKQDFLNNVLGIVKIYFASYLPNQKIVDEIIKDLHLHLDEINNYNEELFDFAINNEAIRNLLKVRGINFE